MGELGGHREDRQAGGGIFLLIACEYCSVSAPFHIFLFFCCKMIHVGSQGGD